MARDELERWREHYRQAGERDADFQTLSGEPLEPLYTPEDVKDLEYDRDLGYPGHYPMTRGVYHTMYRGRPWTMRQFAGFGSAAETNARYKFLLKQGQGGLSVAFDMPTLMGRDSDDPRSEGEVGRCGVATDSLAEQLLRTARARDQTVAVLAIDPTSPFTGGALLGDRLRMQVHATDPSVFIRSMATRGHLGGMALAAPEAIRILDASGKDLVIVETVG
ncbi:MAG: hypothetical protein E6G40_04025, partial [Actinobacteria bacterium]